MVQLTGNELERSPAQAVLIARIKHGRVARIQMPEALVDMHAVAVDAGHRFGHEGAVQAVFLGHSLERRAEGHGVVGRSEGRAIAEVDLVLPHGDFVVGGFDLDPQRLQRIDHLPAHAMGQVGADIEITGPVVGAEGQQATVLMAFEEKEFQLRADLIDKTHFGGARQLALQYIARISLKRRTVGREDIAHDPRRRQVHFPGDDGKGVQIRHQIHVALGDAGEALNGAAVKPDPLFNSIPPMTDGDGDLFGNAHDVRKLNPDKADVVALDEVVDPFQLFNGIVGLHQDRSFAVDVAATARSRNGGNSTVAARERWAADFADAADLS